MATKQGATIFMATPFMAMEKGQPYLKPKNQIQ
jgi:hypothetical protein